MMLSGSMPTTENRSFLGRDLFTVRSRIAYLFSHVWTL
jgi:hypothetical protein